MHASLHPPEVISKGSLGAYVNTSPYIGFQLALVLWRDSLDMECLAVILWCSLRQARRAVTDKHKLARSRPVRWYQVNVRAPSVGVWWEEVRTWPTQSLFRGVVKFRSGLSSTCEELAS